MIKKRKLPQLVDTSTLPTLTILATNKETCNGKPFKVDIIIHPDNKHIKFVQMDTFGDHYKFRWIRLQESEKGTFVTASYFGGRVYLDYHF